MGTRGMKQTYLVLPSDIKTPNPRVGMDYQDPSMKIRLSWMAVGREKQMLIKKPHVP